MLIIVGCFKQAVIVRIMKTRKTRVSHTSLMQEVIDQVLRLHCTFAADAYSVSFRSSNGFAPT